ncbi:MAG: hypothetical protein R3F60_01080 [bacterium]
MAETPRGGDSSKAMAGALDFLHGMEDAEDRFEELSRQLVNNFFVLLRSATMHDLGNEAMRRPVAAMISTARALLAYGDQVVLALKDGNFFVNRRLVKLDFGSFQNARYLIRIFGFLDVNRLVFSSEPDHDTIMLFLQAFLEVLAEKGESPITQYPLGSIKVRKVEETEDATHQRDDDPRRQILATYASGLLMLRQFVNDLRRGRSPRHAKVKRLCLELVDVEPRHHGLLLSLLHLEGYKGNLFCHMLNTAVLAIVFGRRLGLNRSQLVDLGMAAFHHDLGWALVGTLEGTGLPAADEGDDAQLTMDGINDVRDQADVDMEALRVKVARALIRLGGFNELVINRLIVAYECQIPEDSPAEGLYHGEIGASFMTQVVRMASTYDELTTPKATRHALLPDQAMRRILDDGGRTFDDFLARLFAGCIGVYPVGTLVELDSTEIALVVDLPRNPVHFHRPQVKILVDRMGNALPDGPLADLEQTSRTGQFMRSIERTLDSRQYGVSITRFFFG